MGIRICEVAIPQRPTKITDGQEVAPRAAFPDAWLEARTRVASMASWGPVGSIAVGGLVAVGFLDEGRVFVGSHSGVAIVDADSGERIGRAEETDGSYGWFTEQPPSGTWTDQGGTHTVPVAGLWGGRLSETTPDGWRVERLVGGANFTGPDGTTLAIADDEDVRAFGFSPAGRVVIYATSSTLYIAAR